MDLFYVVGKYHNLRQSFIIFVNVKILLSGSNLCAVLVIVFSPEAFVSGNSFNMS